MNSIFRFVFLMLMLVLLLVYVHAGREKPSQPAGAPTRSHTHTLTQDAHAHAYAYALLVGLRRDGVSKSASPLQVATANAATPCCAQSAPALCVRTEVGEERERGREREREREMDKDVGETLRQTAQVAARVSTYAVHVGRRGRPFPSRLHAARRSDGDDDTGCPEEKTLSHT